MKHPISVSIKPAAAHGDDYFDFYLSDFQSGVDSYITDFSSTSGNTDHLFFIGVPSANVNFQPQYSGTDVHISLVGGGISTIHLNGAITGNVINQTAFF